MKKIVIKIENLNFGKKESTIFEPIEFIFKYNSFYKVTDLYKYMLENVLRDYMESKYYESILKEMNIYYDMYFVANDYSYPLYKNIKISKLINALGVDKLVIHTTFASGGDGHCIDTVENTRITMQYNDHNPPHFHVVSSSGNRALVEIKTGKIKKSTLTPKEERYIRKYIFDPNKKQELLEHWRRMKAGLDVNRVGKKRN